MPTTITAIKPLASNPHMAAVHAGGRRVATLRLTAIEKFGLQEGGEWSDALAKRTAEAMAFDRALRAAMQRINRRAMSRAQLREKLAAAGHEPDAVAYALEEAERLGALDDDAMARGLAEELVRKKHAGPEMVRAKLLKRGLGEQAIEAALAKVAAEADPAAAAMALANKKLAGMKRLDSRTQRRRLWGLLGRKGYDAQVVEIVVDKLLGTEANGEE